MNSTIPTNLPFTKAGGLTAEELAFTVVMPPAPVRTLLSLMCWELSQSALDSKAKIVFMNLECSPGDADQSISRILARQLSDKGWHSESQSPRLKYKGNRPNTLPNFPVQAAGAQMLIDAEAARRLQAEFFAKHPEATTWVDAFNKRPAMPTLKKYMEDHPWPKNGDTPEQGELMPFPLRDYQRQAIENLTTNEIKATITIDPRALKSFGQSKSKKKNRKGGK